MLLHAGSSKRPAMSPNSSSSNSSPSSTTMSNPSTTITGNKRDYEDEGAERPAVQLACLACRERHVKCDGVQPICSRCRAARQDCQYIRSRRGYRPTKKKESIAENEKATVQNSTIDVQDLGHGEAFGDPNDLSFLTNSEPLGQAITTQTIQYNGMTTGHNHHDQSTVLINNPSQYLTLSAQPTLRTESTIESINGNEYIPNVPYIEPSHADSRLRELYYQNYHDGHPILVPQNQWKMATRVPDCIAAVMDYIGACYSAIESKEMYWPAVATTLFSERAPRDGHAVQALLLLAIAQHSMDLAEQATHTLDRAIDLALELGMNRRSYATDKSFGFPILAESWRRTWWELYVMDGMFAAVHMKTSFRMHSVPTDVGLPCEESTYRAGNVPPGEPQMLDEVDIGEFAENEVQYSSYTYRILAIRELGKLLALNESFCPDSSEIVIRLDTALNNWVLHLPEGKKDPIDANGRIDEMMFQAHMIICAATIFLHRPRSDLVFTQVQDTTSCTPPRRIAVPASRYAVHTAKAIAAADKIAALVTLPCPMIKHTPFFTCMITLGAVVHLSAHVITKSQEQKSIFKDRLALGVGALKAVREVWAVADSVMLRIKGAAREILGGKMPPPQLALEANVIPDAYNIIGCDLWLDGLQDPIFAEMTEMATRQAMAAPLFVG